MSDQTMAHKLEQQSYMTKMAELQGQIQELKYQNDNAKKRQSKSDEIIRRQTLNVQSLVTAAKNLKEKLNQQNQVVDDRNQEQYDA